MKYATIMHIGDAWWQHWLFAGYFLGIAVAILVSARLAWRKSEGRFVRAQIDFGSLAVIAIVSLFLLPSIWRVTFGAAAALESGDYAVAEGPLETPVERPWKGHVSSLFTVGGVRFAYYDYDALSEGGRITQAGCLKNGAPVRVSYRGDIILRIELGYQPPEPPPPCRQRYRPLLVPPVTSGLYRSS